MRTAAGVALGVVTGTALGWAIAWQFGGRSAGAASSASSKPLQRSEAAFELDGHVHAESEFPVAVQTLIYDGRRSTFDDESNLLAQLAVRLVLARERDAKVRLADVPGFETLITVPEPSEAEVRKVYDENRARLPAQASFDQVKGEVLAFVKAERFTEAIRKKAKALEDDGRLRLLLEEPKAPLVDLPLSGKPVRGKADAAHVLVEAFDYLCPHCQAIKPELDRVLVDFGDELRFVALNYSLKPAGTSGALVRGAFCAAQQGDAEYWRYHDAAFLEAKRQKWTVNDSGGSEIAVDVAREAKLNVEALRTCVDGEAAKEYVVRSNAALTAAGMSGTPTFFLDGRKISHQGRLLRENLQRVMSKSAP